MEIQRIFNGTDSYMLERAQTILAQFNNDVALFITFSIIFDAPYADDYLAAIQAALDFGTDETELDKQTELTNAVVKAMDDCFKKYREVKFFAEQAFPASKSKQNEFGTNDYEGARKSQAKMVQFMTTMHKVALKYQTELLAKGYSDARIAEILTLRDALQTANTAQELFINNRPVTTSERIDILNAVYTFMTRVNDAAQVIFADKDTKKHSYTYLPGGSDSSITKEGNANPGINTIATIEYDAERNITFKNKGTQTLKFGLSDTQTDIKGFVVLLDADKEVTLKSSELFENGTYIICINNNAAPIAYKVEYDN